MINLEGKATSKIIGIDLGTTNSYVTVMEGGKPVVIANVEGIRTTPSVVAFAKTEERLVGELAEHQAVTNADKTISSIKRRVGTDYKVSINDKKYSPQEIPTMILWKLRAGVESYLGGEVTEAVITVPIYFNDVQRRAIKNAGKIAGLDIKCIISRPTAAAPTYGLDDEREQKTMVYDLGGGTFDVSVVEIDDSVIEVLSTSGDTRLGGDDFNSQVARWMAGDFKKAEGVDLSANKMALQRLREAAERAKKELSTATTTNISLSFITAIAEGSKHLNMDLTRVKFDELTHGLAKRTAIPVQNALKDTSITASGLGKMLLIGSSTRTITTQGKVKQLAGQEPSKSLNPDECITIGAAIQGGKLAGDAGAGDTFLLDVTPLSPSIETMGGVAIRLTERDTTIPTEKSQTFSTTTGNQTVVDIHVVQGEGQFVRNNKTLGQFRLDGIPPARRDVPQIEATFDADANGIVSVSAKDSGTDKEQHIIITSGSNISGDDTDKAVKKTAGSETQDEKRKKAIDVRNDADSMVSQTEKVLEEVGGKIDTSDKTAVETDPSVLGKAINRTPSEEMTDAQVEDIKAGKEKLMASAQALFVKVCKATQGVGTVGVDPDMGAGAAGESQPGDDMVDRDFEEA